jgi:opacity protein-like surface antigen
MNRSHVAVAVLVLASIAHSVPALAQVPIASTRPISFGAGGGVSVPVSDAKDAFKNGVNAKGFFRVKLPLLPFALGGDLGYQRFDIEDAFVPGGGTGQILSGLASAQFELMPGPISPYIVLGLGAYNLKTDAGGTENSDTRFGINGGAGLAIRLFGFGAFAEGRVDNVYTEKGLIDASSIQVVPVTFGIVF